MPPPTSRRGEGFARSGRKAHAMPKFLPDLRTLPPGPGALLAKISMSRGPKHFDIFHLDPPGVDCLPSVPAASRGAPPFRLLLVVPLRHLPKALHDDEETDANKLTTMDKNKPDKEKHDETLNLNAARTKVMKPIGLCSEQLDNVNHSENHECTISASEQTWFDVSSEEVEHCHQNVATFCVKVEGTSVCLEQNLSTTTTEMMIEHVCQKKGMRNYDCYAVYLGKVLEDKRLLCDCKVCNNCTVELRGRGRAGRKQEIECTTIVDEMKEINWFREVPLPKSLTNSVTQANRATFLSAEAQWYARQVLISLCRIHYRGKSLNGKFNSSHILFHDGRVVFDGRLKDKEVDFSKDTCKADYKVIAELFEHWFTIPGKRESEDSYPLFVMDLLKYLSGCPLGVKSNSAAAVAFLINHPALTTFVDRVAQCTILDSMVDRLTEDQQLQFDMAVSDDGFGEKKRFNWQAFAEEVPAMRTTLKYDPRSKDIDPESDPHVNKSSNEAKTTYINTTRSCLKFSRNHFKHVNLDLYLERVEASFSLNIKGFLPGILLNTIKNFEGPTNFDIATLLGDHVADLTRKRKLMEAARPAKRPKISIPFVMKKQ